jgi:hypothetical protein
MRKCPEMLSEQLQGEVTKKLVQGLHVEFANMDKYVESLVAEVVGNNHTMSEPEKMALKVIVEMVGKMQNASSIQHAEDKAEIDRMHDLIQNCSLNAAAALRGDVATCEQSMITSRTSHAICRREEGVMKDDMEVTCSKYDSSRKSSSPPSCFSTDLATDFVQATDVVKRKQMEACLELVQGWLPPFYDKYSACRLKTEGQPNKTQDCNAKQHMFEQAFCLYDSKLEDACDVQMNCRASSISARNKAYEGVKASEAARKADFSAGKRLLCFTDVLRANNTQKKETLQKCQGLTANTSKFDITYHSIPNATACNKGQDKPCSNGWNKAEYETQAWYNKSKIASCQPCMQPTTTTTTTTTQADLWIERSLVADEGRDVSGSITPLTTVDACKQACDSNSNCKSFGVCQRNPSGCWMKDKIITPSDAIGRHPRNQNRQCTTWYKLYG